MNADERGWTELHRVSMAERGEHAESFPSWYHSRDDKEEKPGGL